MSQPSDETRLTRLQPLIEPKRESVVYAEKNSVAPEKME